MAKAKGPIFTEKNTIGHSDLLKQLQEAVNILEDRMRATIPIHKGNHRIGFGVDKTKRGIAADSVASIAKAIKAQKGW